MNKIIYLVLTLLVIQGASAGVFLEVPEQVNQEEEFEVIMYAEDISEVNAIEILLEYEGLEFILAESEIFLDLETNEEEGLTISLYVLSDETFSFTNKTEIGILTLNAVSSGNITINSNYTITSMSKVYVPGWTQEQLGGQSCGTFEEKYGIAYPNAELGCYPGDYEYGCNWNTMGCNENKKPCAVDEDCNTGEACDGGNYVCISSSNPIRPYSEIEGAISGLCGNGVIDEGEQCDKAIDLTNTYLPIYEEIEIAPIGITVIATPEPEPEPEPETSSSSSSRNRRSRDSDKTTPRLKEDECVTDSDCSVNEVCTSIINENGIFEKNCVYPTNEVPSTPEPTVITPKTTTYEPEQEDKDYTMVWIITTLAVIGIISAYFLFRRED